ncbi:bifunctional ornithine acetyltransferase/N-acetylglutamate synthase [Bacillus sp. SL00103]
MWRYTHKATFAAPLQVTQKSLKKTGQLKGVIVNSAIANACTGEQGLKDAYEMQAACADMLGVEPDYIAVSSTGVIGECLDMDKIKKASILS